WRDLLLHSSILRFFYFFFFQAEDGIRDKLVTGVQTCALPIWQECRSCFSSSCCSGGSALLPGPSSERPSSFSSLSSSATSSTIEIGRASCRERVEISVGAVAVKTKRENKVEHVVHRKTTHLRV